ncbi:MAG TPA: class D sortase [Vicinamibacterales bacterium]|nr:class D sortase [Vicinamibacterales bacterium]
MSREGCPPKPRRRRAGAPAGKPAARSGRRRLAIVERVLYVLAAILLGWYLLQHGITAYQEAAANRELESVHMAVEKPASTEPRLTNGALIGRVDIPRVGVSAIVREGDDAATLRHAVGHIPDTALPGASGNAGLAGHRDTFFRGLKGIRAGDRIRMTTANGILEYTVRDTRVVDPDDVSVLRSTGRPTLTLVTCYPFYYIGSAPRRFIVQAEIAQN